MLFEMDFFQHRYYRLSKTLMTLGGYWPYQSTRAKCGRTAALIFILITQIAPQTLALVKHHDEGTVIVECTLIFLFEAICLAKGIGCLWNSQKLMKLLNRIRVDWQVWARDREVKILHECAEQGRKMSLAFTVLIYSVGFVYVAQPAIPKIIDVLLKNGTAPGQFSSPLDYYHIDAQKYYFYIVTYIYICQCMGLVPYVASEVMLFIYVQHVCGIFAALGCKLQRIGNNKISLQSGEMSYALNERDIADIVSCIDRHNDVINSSNLIEATYTWTIFYIVGFGMIMLNLVGLQILMGSSNPEVTIRFVGLALASISHFFVECYISQVLMDHSIGIHSHIYDSQWYKMAPKAQNLVQLMIMRCSVSCKLTAGHFFQLSMTTFGQTLRTGISYFTVLRSAQM